MFRHYRLSINASTGYLVRKFVSGLCSLVVISDHVEGKYVLFGTAFELAGDCSHSSENGAECCYHVWFWLKNGRRRENADNEFFVFRRKRPKVGAMQEEPTPISKVNPKQDFLRFYLSLHYDYTGLISFC